MATGLTPSQHALNFAWEEHCIIESGNIQDHTIILIILNLTARRGLGGGGVQAMRKQLRYACDTILYIVKKTLTGPPLYM